MTHPALTSTASPVRPGDWTADPAVPAGADHVDLHATGCVDRRSAGVTAGPALLIGHTISLSLTVRLLPPAGSPQK